MAWDPTHPATSGAVVSGPLRDNFAALDTILVAPLTALAANQLLVKAAGPVIAGVTPGTNGWVLTLVAGVPTWVALPVDPGFANPMTTLGDLILGGAGGAPGRLGIGTTGTVLQVTAGTAAWSALVTALGDLIIGNASGQPSVLPVGSTGYVLTVVSGAPAWAAVPVDPGFASPMTTLGDLIVGASGGTPARLGVGTAGQVLTVSSGTPTWAAPTGGAVSVVPLPLDAARFPDGTANNNFPQPVERISTGTPPSGAPKIVTLVYQFDPAATVPAQAEFLIWKVHVPVTYAGGTITVVSKWSMVSAITGNFRPTAAVGPVVDGATDVRGLVVNNVTFSADVAVPTTLGQQKEVRLAVDPNNAAAGRVIVVSLGMWLATANNALGDRILEAAWLEFA
jgi:hypothetical protein